MSSTINNYSNSIYLFTFFYAINDIQLSAITIETVVTTNKKKHSSIVSKFEIWNQISAN